MKKCLSLLLILCLLCSPVFSRAETTALHFEQGGFEATLPEGWYFGFSTDNSTFYYGNPDCSMDDGMIFFLYELSSDLTGVSLTDEYYTQMYNALLQSAASTAVDGKIDSMETKMIGKRSLVYWCRTVIDDSGVPYATAAHMTIIDSRLFAIMLYHPAAEPEDLRDIVLSIGETVRYAGAEEEPQPDTDPEETGDGYTSPEDLPTADNPYSFPPTITERQNLLLPQWMIDDGSRAVLAMVLTLDMSLSYGTMNLPYPMNMFAGSIGYADDTILLFVPSQDETVAFIFRYDTAEHTASYYAEPWSEEAVAAFEASCTDEFYPLTEEALNYAAQLMMDAFNNPQD